MRAASFVGPNAFSPSASSALTSPAARAALRANHGHVYAVASNEVDDCIDIFHTDCHAFCIFCDSGIARGAVYFVYSRRAFQRFHYGVAASAAANHENFSYSSSLMFEMAHSGEKHCDPFLVGHFYRVFVANASAGLHNGSHSIFGGEFHSVAKRQELRRMRAQALLLCRRPLPLQVRFRQSLHDSSVRRLHRLSLRLSPPRWRCSSHASQSSIRSRAR